MLNTLTELITGCCGVSDDGNGQYSVSFPDGSTRPVTELEILAATEIKARNDIEPVSAAQFRLALLDVKIGLLDEVEAFVAQASREIKLNWEYRQEFDRNHPLVIGSALALGKTPEEMDAVFALAKTK